MMIKYTLAGLHFEYPIELQDMIIHGIGPLLVSQKYKELNFDQVRIQKGNLFTLAFDGYVFYIKEVKTVRVS